MTTIAYKAGIVAADTLVSNQGYFDSLMTKIVANEDNSIIAGASGSAIEHQHFLQCFKADLIDPAFCDWKILNPEDKEFEGHIFYIKDGVEMIGCYNYQGVMHSRISGCFAVGSGYQYAWGAMLAGSSASQAVRIASLCDLKTNSRIEEYKLSAYNTVLDT